MLDFTKGPFVHLCLEDAPLTIELLKKSSIRCYNVDSWSESWGLALVSSIKVLSLFM